MYKNDEHGFIMGIVIETSRPQHNFVEQGRTDDIKETGESVSFVRNLSARMTESQCSFENEPDSSNEYLEETCIFCTIANGDDPYTEILAEDEDIVCFKDINPGAPHHYLVIPKKHIHSCLSLQADDISLVKRMAEMGRDVLKAQDVTDFEDISLGFHVPPYITVPHLHLHVLAPFSQMFIWSEEKYTNFWYLTEEKIRHKLTTKSQMIGKGRNKFMQPSGAM